MKIQLQRGKGVPPLKNRTLFLRFLRNALPLTGFDPKAPGIIQFILLGTEEMTSLNGLHLGHEGATDVITYDLRDEDQLFPDEENILAEIYICPDVAIKNAEQFQQSSSKELFLYAVHGLLHLQGEDDIEDADRASMRAAEKRVLDHFQGQIDEVDFF